MQAGNGQAERNYNESAPDYGAQTATILQATLSQQQNLHTCMDTARPTKMQTQCCQKNKQFSCAPKDLTVPMYMYKIFTQHMFAVHPATK